MTQSLVRSVTITLEHPSYMTAGINYVMGPTLGGFSSLNLTRAGVSFSWTYVQTLRDGPTSFRAEGKLGQNVCNVPRIYRHIWHTI